MTIDERSRHALYTGLQEVLGEERATVLMEHLPPVGWADVATKQDLRTQLEATENRLMASFHAEISRLYAEMNRQTRTLLVGLPTAFAAIAGIVVGAAQLL